MIKTATAICALLATDGWAAAGPTLVALGESDSLGWSVMTDAFGTEVDYPAGIFTMEAGSPPRGIGRVLQSSDGEARFMVYVEENEAHQSPAVFVRSNLSMPNFQIDYRRITDHFFAVSGVKDGRSFYSRCNFSHGTHGRMHCIFLSYSAREKRAWDNIVTRISLSLRESR
jgi:hypothetical protein